MRHRGKHPIMLTLDEEYELSNIMKEFDDIIISIFSGNQGRKKRTRKNKKRKRKRRTRKGIKNKRKKSKKKTRKH